MKKALGQVLDMKTTLQRAGVTLQDDEVIVSQSIIHPAIYWKGVAVLVLAVLLLPTFLQNLSLLFLFVGVVMLILAYMTRRYLILLATDKRLIVRSGILYADMIELRYAQVESVELGINIIGQLFGYGSVVVTGTGQRRIIVPYISNALDFRSKVNDILVNK